MRKTWFGLSLLVCMTAVLGACSDGGGGGGSLAALGVDDGASQGVSKSVTTSATEDVRITLKTGALMDVPAGAVSKNVELTMERPADTKAVELVERFKKMQDRIVSAPYVLTPHGTKFKEEVTLTLPLAKTGKGEVSVAWLEDENDTEWKFLGKAKTDAAGKKAEVKIKHFSVVVIVEDASDLEPVDDIVDQPAADAGGVVADAGGSALDAGAVSDAAVEGDAGSAEVDARSAEVDAGAAIDAGALDARVAEDTSVPPVTRADAGGTPTDAGSTTTSEAAVVIEAGVGDDASVPSDSGAVADAGASDSGPAIPPDAGDAGDADTDSEVGPPPSAQYSALNSCGYIVSAGNFSIGGGWFGSPFDGPSQMCMHQCYATAGSCFDNQVYRCGIDAGPSQSLIDCQAACSEPSTVCPNDGGISAQICNGVIDCPFGVDEQDCDPNLFFTCQGTERVAMFHLCDGEMNCSGNQDEQNCFFCADDNRRLPPYRVCDGVLDCNGNDFSDEQQGCAAVQCALID